MLNNPKHSVGNGCQTLLAGDGTPLIRKYMYFTSSTWEILNMLARNNNTSVSKIIETLAVNGPFILKGLITNDECSNR